MATSEAKVISAVCKNKDIHTILSEDDDLFGAYKDVFGFLREHYLRHKAVPSPETIHDKFPDVELPAVNEPTPYYLEGLKNEFVSSGIEQAVTKTATALDNGRPSKYVLDRLQTELARLGRYTATGRDLDVTDGEAAEEYLRKIRAQSEEKGGIPGISTGFKSIDSVYTTGMAGGHFIVGMGYTGRTKSMWSDLLAVNVWNQGYKPMIISMEMSPEEQRERIYALMGNGTFKISDLARGDISMDDFSAFRKRRLADSSQFVVVSSEGLTEMTPNTVQAKIDTHRPDFVVLDYLQLMKDNAKTQAMTPRMLNLSREVKMLAMSNNIPILALTAVTDEDGDKRDSPPVLSQISWSSGIEFDANLAIAIHLHGEGSNLVEVVCRKNRHGEMFNFYFQVDLDRGIWVEKHSL